MRRTPVVPGSALVGLALLTLPACATVRQDEIGVKRTLGRVGETLVAPGPQLIVPGFQSVIRLPIRTINREVRLDLPTREGLNVAAEVSILYRLKPEAAPRILETAGTAYEDALVLPVFRSAAADVSARFMAKDLHSGERGVIERSIKDMMMKSLESRGVVVESTLLKSIRLPAGLAEAVEQKLEAEQRSEQMKFVLERERQEADRRRVEAEGIRDAQQIIGTGLTPMVISFQSIQAFRELAQSPNARIIVTDGRSPFLINPTESGVGTLPAMSLPSRRPTTDSRRAASAPVDNGARP